MTTHHERDKETGYDNRGARLYDSEIAIFRSCDPWKNKYPAWSTYNYVMGNPIKFVDPTGKGATDIVVPNESDRSKVLTMINDRAKGTFDFDKNGKLYVVKKEGGERFSENYRDRLIAGIENKKTIEISITDCFIWENGKEYETDKNCGGGATSRTGDKVWISGNENKNIKDTSGKPLRDEPADILMHELVGHAIPIIAGGGTGNAVDNENIVRQQYKEKGQVGESPLRKAEPKHKEKN